MQEKDVIDMPLVYPLVSITLKTTAVVDDRAVLNECEEILNLADGTAAARIQALTDEFTDYVKRVIATAQSPQGRGALQNILDNHSRETSQNLADSPLKPGSLEGLDQRSLPEAPPAASPDKAAL